MKYALFINGVADTIAYQEPLEKIGVESYQVQQGFEEYDEQVGEATVVDEETGALVTEPVIEKRRRPLYVTLERDVMVRTEGFVEVPDDVLPGFLKEGDAFVAPPPALDDVRAKKLGELERLAAAKRVRVAGTSDGLKMAVYQQKFEVALAAVAGDEQALAVLKPEADARSETPKEFAELVVRLGHQWRAAGLMIDARYQTAKHTLEFAQTVEELEAVDLISGWPV